jgi:PmbA protein
MEQLLDLARRAADAVEICSRSSEEDDVAFENGRLKDIKSTMQYGVGLLVMKSGRLGYAYTHNLTDRAGLVANALAAATDGVKAEYDLPFTRDVAVLDTYEPSIEAVSSSDLVEEGARICNVLGGRTNGQVDIDGHRAVTTVRLINSRGTDLSTRSSAYTVYAALNYPGTRSSVYHLWSEKAFTPAAAADLEDLLDTFQRSQREVRPPSGRIKVLFLPQSMFVLMWRLSQGLNGKALYEGVSPLRDKVGESVLGAPVTLVDRPLDDRWPGSRSFDDEGTPCQDTTLLEGGVLRSFYFDRYYAWKMGVAPTGHGFRSGVASRVSPSLRHFTMDSGSQSKGELLRAMDTGIVVAGVMGAHSGNLLNGDFSIGLSPGLYVEHGEIVGQVKDAMVAGNVYDVMQRVIGVGDTLAIAPMSGRFPAVLLDGVSYTVG